MYACIGACVYDVYVYMYVCVYIYIYIDIRARVGVNIHSCRCIFFMCTVQSLYYMRVYHRCFLIPECVFGRGIGSGFCFSLLMVSACYWRERLYLAGVEIEVLSCVFFYFCGWWGGGCVCACIRAYTHTN